MSGLFTAAFLRQIGWDCDVYERSGVELVGRGAGITTHPELLDALEASGAGTRDLGIEVPKRIALDRNGRVTGERPLRQILTSWDRLQRLLRETIDPAHYHLGWAFERVEQNGSGVRVHFNGGRVEDADILVGGDGIRSTVRGAGRAGAAADLCRLLHLARRAERGRSRAEDAEGDLSVLRVLPAAAPGGHHLPDLGLQRRPAARPPPLQFHLVPRRRRREAPRDERRRERRASTSSRCRRRSSART